MFRKVSCLGLIALLLCSIPASADPRGRPPSDKTPSQSTSGSSKTRVIWTLVGIGAGFGAGLFIGLHAFDDSTNSDRKVWTSAIVGAAAGGVAGALLTRKAGRVAPLDVTALKSPRATTPSAPWTAFRPMVNDADLRRRVREITAVAPMGQ